MGENPVNVSRGNIVAVIPTWGPIWEFTFDMRINIMPYVERNRVHHDGMVMRLATEVPTTISYNSQQGAPILYLRQDRLDICIHNRTNLNEQRIDCNAAHYYEQLPEENFISES